MKRFFYTAGFIATLSVFGSCAQHDPNSPDTAGTVPVDQRGGMDSTGNSMPDSTNGNGQMNTADSSRMKQ